MFLKKLESWQKAGKKLEKVEKGGKNQKQRFDNFRPHHFTMEVNCVTNYLNKMFLQN